MKFKILYLFMLATFVGCGHTKKENNTTTNLSSLDPVEVKATQEGYKKAYFASGCFWCVEAIYESVKGVKESISGYAGGTGENPTYQNYGKTDHAEVVEIIYDPKVVSYETLLDVYFASQNVTQKNGQGPDLGREYRSVIFYQNETEKQWIESKIAEVSKQYSQPVAAEVMPFQKFWIAEDYHQDYKKHNPHNSYIRGVSIPRFNKFKEKFPNNLLKEKYQK
ncbi:peptide-methionine (S)-S-oxide reductase [Mesonia phycicola]|uniref:Peptide methionine sulfoxide reductase MsrA n=1 Tax=Mesonia phycicola TaxID=579105 RepID=A0A1M6F9P4_9FLAO|nr:peptide-methionine (S)-S-oxide reductase MsrA [Mesonia phycicola]SHI94376.1 peptide-methionine (S)-S-oxide reductase [Mesonia phycicola]